MYLSYFSPSQDSVFFCLFVCLFCFVLFCFLFYQNSGKSWGEINGENESVILYNHKASMLVIVKIWTLSTNLKSSKSMQKWSKTRSRSVGIKDQFYLFIYLFIYLLIYWLIDLFIYLFFIFILFHFILFYFILFYFILFYFILFYFILFYFILFILFYFILFILFYFILFYFILFYLFVCLFIFIFLFIFSWTIEPLPMLLNTRFIKTLPVQGLLVDHIFCWLWVTISC